ncbi:D-mannose binding lectin protein with Apple-like carbohydrate-binding domain-containing protein [Tasmannia lanceolata]|uniref:D-mannose binding lectin protein with Apple-like carbohydrate-binding domain-containing protein n=1 Tax=Tasmannia lanceolata TaxID=3420 RepID=UPI004063D0B5
MRLHLLGFFLIFFIDAMFSQSNFLPGNPIILSIPLVYEAGFQGKTFILQAGEKIPYFKAAISVEAFDGKYLCSLVVLLGELQVWSSVQFSRFFLSGSCMIELLENGVLQLKDSSGQIGWQTGTFGQGVEKLQLLRTGNLVLTDAKNHIKWQSFDIPADIMLWSQRLNVPARLISFSGNSSTFFSFEIQHDKIALYLNSSKDSYSYWEFKPEKNQSITFATLGSTGLRLFNSKSKKIAHISSSAPEPIRFMALGKAGNLDFYHYSPYKEMFIASFHVLNNVCDLPLACGLYGICTFSQNCTCMHFPKQSYSVDSECGEGFSNQFCGRENDDVKMVEVKDVTSVLKGDTQRVNVSKEECSSWCLEDCSCAAVLFSDGGAHGARQECVKYELVGGVKEVELGLGLSYMVKERIGESNGSSFKFRNWILVLGEVVDVLAIMFIAGGLVYYFLMRKRKKALEGERTFSS